MQWLTIVALSILTCVTYGIIHDQVTARICVEYFTIGHPPIIPTDNPPILGFVWGVVATWWVGAILGVPLATIARIGSRPKKAAGSSLRPMANRVLAVIDCPNCDIQFTPECEACPKCHDFVPPLSARKPYLERKAKEFADYNASKSDVRDYLADSGLSDFDSDEILRAAFRKSAAENRMFAVKQILGGGGLALIGGIGCFTPAILYAGGLMIAGLGVFAIGVYSLVTGKT